jgi:2,4-dienoyl-CoA reductase-like NADH-dependent reductase (Old Yellow Enzyme family)/thioredoxin reductase
MDKLVKLFEPGKINKMDLKNRLVLAPIGGMSRATEPGGFASDELINFYAQHARGGVSFIQLSVQTFGGAFYGFSNFSGHLYGSGLLSIEDDEHIPSAQRFNKVMHAYGAKVSFQITYYGRKFLLHLKTEHEAVQSEQMKASAPSAIKDPFTGLVPNQLTIEEIERIIEESGQAARRGKAGGFDAVRLQGAHGYGIHQFLCPRTNTRTDKYGGSIENRCRFAVETIKRVRKEVGPDFPIIMRMNGSDFLDDGIKLEDAIEHARIFEAAGVDALDISAGGRETHHWENLTLYQPYGGLVPLAAAIKKAVKVPIIAVSKINAPLAEHILEEGAADFVEMGRALIADPELPNKAKEGRLEDVRPCIYCNQCQETDRFLNDEGAKGGRYYCAVNPEVGHELEGPTQPAAKKKKVMVIGGGLAGMETALVAAERGHQVSLYEKSDKLGGQWNLLCAFKSDLNILTKYLTHSLEKAGVQVYLNQEVDSTLVEQLKPDSVVVATGALPTAPDVSGIKRPQVVQATDVLAAKAKVGEEVVVIGGRYVGLDTALYLAERGKKVSVVETRKVGWGLNHRQRFALIENLIKSGVHLYPDSTLESVTEHGVNILWDGGEPAVKSGRSMFYYLKADTVVLAVGSRSQNDLGEQLSGFMPEVFSVGDCVKPRSVLAAFYQGWTAARKI